MKIFWITIWVLTAVCAAGCASYREVDAPSFSASFELVAESSKKMMEMKASVRHEHGYDKRLLERDGEYAERFLQKKENVELLDRVEKLSRGEGLGAVDIDSLSEAIEQNKKLNMEGLGAGDERFRVWLTDLYAKLKEIVDAKIVEVLDIRPMMDLSEGTGAVVAIIEIGDGVRTIRKREREAWQAFFKKAGFDSAPVFIPEYMVGEVLTSDAIRQAAASLGADGALIYTTLAEVDESILGESVAAIGFAKCLFIDTRTEYLYFSAEGDSRDKQLTLLFMSDASELERHVVNSAIECMFSEIMHELKRLRSEPRQ